MKIGGTTFIHNGVDHDYCFVESITSMLGVCSEVVVVEAESTDGTVSALRLLANSDPRIRIISAPWDPQPLNQATNTDWTKDLAELARTCLSTDVNLYIQADEVIHEKDYPLIRKYAQKRVPVYFKRLNFWVDSEHLAPHFKVCGHIVCRMASSKTPVIWGSESLDDKGAIHSPIRLFHYGFLRNGSGFRKKSEIMQPNFIGALDPIIYEYEKHGPKAFSDCFPQNSLIQYTGSHPKVAHQWLRDRGHTAS